jgi:glycerol-3-phosphate dehydrogenase
MAEDGVDHAQTLAKLDEKPCVTKNLKIHGHTEDGQPDGHMSVYGSDAVRIKALIEADSQLGEKLNPALPYTAAEVVFAARFEMSCTVEDFLARRVRALFLNSGAAIKMAPKVAELMAAELNKDEQWQKDQVQQFLALAKQYAVPAVAETAVR